MILWFRCQSAAELLFVHVQATKLELGGPKSHAPTVQSGLKGSSQSGQDSQVGPVGSVLLSDLWNPPEPSRTSGQAGGQSLSNWQDIWLDLLYIYREESHTGPSSAQCGALNYRPIDGNPLAYMYIYIYIYHMHAYICIYVYVCTLWIWSRCFTFNFMSTQCVYCVLWCVYMCVLIIVMRVV